MIINKILLQYILYTLNVKKKLLHKTFVGGGHLKILDQNLYAMKQWNHIKGDN